MTSTCPNPECCDGVIYEADLGGSGLPRAKRYCPVCRGTLHPVKVQKAMTAQEKCAALSFDLRHCPFCGCPPIVDYKPGSYGYTHSSAQIKCAAGCCEQSYRDLESWESGKGTFSVIDQALDKLKANWNQRNGA